MRNHAHAANPTGLDNTRQFRDLAAVLSGCNPLYPGFSANNVMSAVPTTIARIVGIIRRDLKFGPEIALVPDTILFGGELDLDSLDALLLVQSIEKDFGIKVPTDAIGPEMFATLGTLT